MQERTAKTASPPESSHAVSDSQLPTENIPTAPLSVGAIFGKQAARLRKNLLRIVHQLQRLIQTGSMRNPSRKNKKQAKPTAASHIVQINGELDVIHRFIPQDGSPVIFDVGANCGDWCAPVLEACPKARVHAFEPIPAMFEALEQRFASQINEGQLRINNLALSDSQKSQIFNYYPSNSTLSTFHRRAGVEESGKLPPPEVLTIPCLPLDTYCAEADIRRINFLKIDTEGHEISVIRGARGMLAKGDIDVIQFEYGGTYSDAGVRLQDVFELFKEPGYLLFKITPEQLVHCPGFQPEMEDYQYANFLALHPRFRCMALGTPPEMFDIPALLKLRGITPRGVIHLGAHEGKEYETYKQVGFEKMLFVEANPAVFARLAANLAEKTEAILAQCAVSDREGTATFRVTSFDQSSSLLPLKEHKTLYPKISEKETIEVRTVTLDGLLTEMGLSVADFNFLNIDIQGAELLALRGAVKTLAHIDAINTEINLAELYEGCALLEEIDTFLEDFVRTDLTTPWHPSWGDAFYVRKP